ncbi:hypothetical protein TNCV_3961201 [Trichonephila clavipes]|nr:hypothetical protein TNCV_3961201 [Trichonephila clavipes]
MKKGGFPIRKWANAMNHLVVLESLPTEFTSSSGSLNMKRILMKIFWNHMEFKEDTFRINISPPNETVRPTKRQLLSTIAKFA